MLGLKERRMVCLQHSTPVRQTGQLVYTALPAKWSHSSVHGRSFVFMDGYVKLFLQASSGCQLGIFCPVQSWNLAVKVTILCIFLDSGDSFTLKRYRFLLTPSRDPAFIFVTPVRKGP